MGCVSSSSSQKEHHTARPDHTIPKRLNSASIELREHYCAVNKHSLPAWYDASASSKSLEEKRDAIRTAQRSFRMILAGEASRFRALERFHTDLTPLSFFFNQFFCHLAVLRPSAKIFTRSMREQGQYLRVVLMMPIQKMLELDGDQKVDFDHLLEELTAETVAVSERLGLTSCYQFVDCYVAAYGALSTCLSADFMPVAEAWQTFFSLLITTVRSKLPDDFFTSPRTNEMSTTHDSETRGNLLRSETRRLSMTRQLVKVAMSSPHARGLEPLIWTKDVSVGLPWLDADHQWLYIIITAMYSAINNNLEDGIDSVLAVASGLIDYSISHFGAEEAVFVEHNLDEVYIKSHQAEHDKFVEIVRDARRRLTSLRTYLEVEAPATEDEKKMQLPGHLFDHNMSPKQMSNTQNPSGKPTKLLLDGDEEPQSFDLVQLYTFLRNWLDQHVRVKDQVYRKMIFGADKLQ